MSGEGHVHLVPPATYDGPKSEPCCEIGGCEVQGVYLMPQLDKTERAGWDPTLNPGDPMHWQWLVVCALHAEGWWDGDNPEASRHPLLSPWGYMILPVSRELRGPLS